MEKSGFFDSLQSPEGEYDREYAAKEFAQYFANFIGNGVYATPFDSLQAHFHKSEIDSGGEVVVNPGKAFIDGYWYENTDTVRFGIPKNTSGLLKTYGVVCRLDVFERKIALKLIPDFTSDSLITESHHDIVLEILELSPGGNYQATDTRTDKKLCGFVSGLIEQIDFSNAFEQMETTFITWFDKIKNQLSTDAAGHLQNEIDDLVDTLITQDTQQLYKELGMI